MTNHDDPATDYQSPTAIRDMTFRRKMLGLDLDQVYEYLDLLADQVQAAERAARDAQSENENLRSDLERVQAALDEYEQAGDRVNDQVVQMFSQAQLVAEQMVEDVSRDARDRLGQARAHERRIVEEAMDTAGAQVRSYAQAAQSQMQAIMQSFAAEVDRVGGSSRELDPLDSPPLDMSRRWEIQLPRRGTSDPLGPA